MEYNLYRDLGEISEGELVSMFSDNSTSRKIFKGTEIIDIFGDSSPVVSRESNYYILIDMINLLIVFNRGDKNEAEIDLSKISDNDKVDIIDRMMDNCGTNFLVSYLGSVLSREGLKDE